MTQSGRPARGTVSSLSPKYLVSEKRQKRKSKVSSGEVIEDGVGDVGTM